MPLPPHPPSRRHAPVSSFVAVLLFAVIGGGAWATRASACATCAVGDPTLTTMGAGQPYAHRVRLSAGFRHRRDRLGDVQVDGIRLREQRFALGVAYSPIARLTLSLQAPLVRRDVTFPNLARDISWGLGDFELVVRGVLFRDRELAARHILSALVGIEMPTGRARRGADGELLPLELQAGSGSWDPSVGLQYGFFADPWSVFVSTVLLVPTPGFERSRGGPSLRVTAFGQFQPHSAFGLRAGAMVRVDGVAREGGAQEPDSGGSITFATLGVVAAPVQDVVIQAMLALPVLQALEGEHREGIAFELGVSVDL